MSGGQLGLRAPLTPLRTPPGVGPYNQPQPLPSGRGWAIIILAQTLVASGRGPRLALLRPYGACPRADFPPFPGRQAYKGRWAASMASVASVGEAGGGQGLSPRLHCPLNCPCWPAGPRPCGSPQRPFESRPCRAAWRMATRRRERGGREWREGEGGVWTPPPDGVR